MDEYVQAVLQNKPLPCQSQTESPVNPPTVQDPPVVDPTPSQPANPPAKTPSPYSPQRMTSIEDYCKAVLNHRSTPVYHTPAPQNPLPPDVEEPGDQVEQPAPPAPPSLPSAPEGLTAAEERLFGLINSSRINEGVSPVEIDTKLTEIARLKAKDMIDNNYFGHISPTYGSPSQMLRKFGVSFRSGGENLCKAGDVYKANMLLLNSTAGHRENMLNPKANRVGVAVVPQQNWVLVVELFAEM